jgi:N-methylhydantoinase A
MQEHVDAGMRLLDAARVAFESRDAGFELDMAYVGQTHTVAVPLPVTVTERRVMAPEPDAIGAAFDAAYTRVYGRLLPGGTARVLNLRSTVTGRRPKVDLALLAPGPEATLEAAGRPSRQVYAGGAWHRAAVFDRLALPVGARIAGPAILEQPDATIFIDPGLVGTVDRFGNAILTREDHA